MSLQCRRPWFDSWVGKIRWRRDRLPTPVFWGFPCGSPGKESACRVGDLGLIPGLGRFLRDEKGYPLQYSGLELEKVSNFHFSLSCIGEGNGNPFQCSCLENPRDGGAWWAAIYGVAQSRTRLSSSSSMYSFVFVLFCSILFMRYIHVVR